MGTLSGRWVCFGCVGLGSSKFAPVGDEGILTTRVSMQNWTSDAPVDGILDMLANAGGFEVYFSVEVKELPPVTLRFKGAFYEDALRGALKITGVRYRVVDGALLISVRPRSEVF